MSAQLDMVAGSTDEPRPFFDALSAAGRKKLGAPEGWAWCRSEVIAGGFLLAGAVPKRGRDGRERWRGVPLTRVILTENDLRAAEMEYEATTGKCYRCAGCGETLASAAMKDGGGVVRTYRACARCSGAGTAPAAPAGAA